MVLWNLVALLKQSGNIKETSDLWGLAEKRFPPKTNIKKNTKYGKTPVSLGTFPKNSSESSIFTVKNNEIHCFLLFFGNVSCKTMFWGFIVFFCFFWGGGETLFWPGGRPANQPDSTQPVMWPGWPAGQYPVSQPACR